MLRDLRFRLRALFRRRAVERELDDELQFHLDRAIEAKLAEGHTREEATRLARLELGGVEQVKEDARDARGVRPLEDLVGDVRYGLRILRRTPAFSAIAIVTLALGIGVNTAMFSLVDAVLRRPLPYHAPTELVRLHASKPSYERGSISYPNFVDWQAQNHSFATMAVARGGAFTLTGTGPAERVSASLVSSDYFTVLAIDPLVGRGFAKREAEPGGEPIAILGERLWRRRFGATADVVGHTVVLDGKGYAIIGVMPAAQDLHAVAGGDPADVYLPIGQFNPEALAQRGAGLGIHGIARLAPGVTIAQARADLAGVTRELAQKYPDVDRSTTATIDPLRDSVVGNVRPYVLLMFGAVGLVLLIACVNVANLLLARSAGRSREIAIRLAVGASAGRLVRQLLTESLLLAVGGGALGLLVAWWCAESLFGLLPSGMPHTGALGLDAGMLAFTASISLLSGVLAGLTPALRAARTDLHDTLKAGGRGPSTTRYRAQIVFAVIQIALAFVLLVGAGMLVRTLVSLAHADPGYAKDGVVTLGVSLPPGMRGAPPARIRAELHRLDGAIGGGSLAANGVPIEGDDQTLFYRDDRPTPEREDQMAWAQQSIVGPSYFATMRIAVLHGRAFTSRDDERVPRVAVIDDVFARAYFPEGNPVGKRIRLSAYNFEPVEIVGVVAHTKQWGLDQDDTTPVRAQLYIALFQIPDDALGDAPPGLVVIARAPPGPLRTAIEALSAEHVVYDVRTLDQIITGYQTTRRFSMYVLAAFALLALVLSCVGIYGVVSYIVAQRTTEIGIRMALGARASDILRLVLRQGVKLVLIGVSLGLVGAAAVSPYLAKLVYGIPALDPITLVAVAAAISAVAILAIVVPARRAMRTDPMQALRSD